MQWHSRDMIDAYVLASHVHTVMSTACRLHMVSECASKVLHPFTSLQIRQAISLCFYLLARHGSRWCELFP